MSPLSAPELLPYFADCADRAQEVGADVFVAGCELSLFAAGFLPGDDSFARIKALTSGTPEAMTRFAGYEATHHTDPRFDLDTASYAKAYLLPG